MASSKSLADCSSLPLTSTFTSTSTSTHDKTSTSFSSTSTSTSSSSTSTCSSSAAVAATSSSTVHRSSCSQLALHIQPPMSIPATSPRQSSQAPALPQQAISEAYSSRQPVSPLSPLLHPQSPVNSPPSTSTSQSPSQLLDALSQAYLFPHHLQQPGVVTSKIAAKQAGGLLHQQCQVSGSHSLPSSRIGHSEQLPLQCQKSGERQENYRSHLVASPLKKLAELSSLSAYVVEPAASSHFVLTSAPSAVSSSSPSSALSRGMLEQPRPTFHTSPTKHCPLPSSTASGSFSASAPASPSESAPSVHSPSGVFPSASMSRPPAVVSRGVAPSGGVVTPPEVAFLVLVYLQRGRFTRTYQTFLQEARHLVGDAPASTSVKGLDEILNEYLQLMAREQKRKAFADAFPASQMQSYMDSLFDLLEAFRHEPSRVRQSEGTPSQERKQQRQKHMKSHSDQRPMDFSEKQQRKRKRKRKQQQQQVHVATSGTSMADEEHVVASGTPMEVCEVQVQQKREGFVAAQLENDESDTVQHARNSSRNLNSSTYEHESSSSIPEGSSLPINRRKRFQPRRRIESLETAPYQCDTVDSQSPVMPLLDYSEALGEVLLKHQDVIAEKVAYEINKHFESGRLNDSKGAHTILPASSDPLNSGVANLQRSSTLPPETQKSQESDGDVGSPSLPESYNENVARSHLSEAAATTSTLAIDYDDILRSIIHDPTFVSIFEGENSAADSCSHLRHQQFPDPPTQHCSVEMGQAGWRQDRLPDKQLEEYSKAAHQRPQHDPIQAHRSVETEQPPKDELPYERQQLKAHARPHPYPQLQQQYYQHRHRQQGEQQQPKPEPQQHQEQKGAGASTPQLPSNLDVDELLSRIKYD